MTKWNDLPKLEDIKDIFTLKKINNKNIEDFKESIYYFVEEYMKIIILMKLYSMIYIKLSLIHMVTI